MDTTTRVRIVDKDHPHYGESGHLTGTIISVVGKRMAEMKIEHCRHGTDGCFISRGQIEIERRSVIGS